MIDARGRYFLCEEYEAGRGWVTYRIPYVTAEGAAPTTPPESPSVPTPAKGTETCDE